MKSLMCVIFTLLALAAASPTDSRRQIGICVEECSLTLHALGASSCPTGTACMSNGCGHTCQAVATAKPAPSGTACPPVLCKMFCFNGFALGADGCPVCKCQ
ncbi:antistasin isoform X1 [Aplysia californica]|uniref:Antistasin isoform X1 n=1 Tax=Aplysia californica TaxID=6500 RepID=A0ABM0JFR8_APLCA|nr:antistasin isoform X1 [Aplysia californica]